MPVTIKDVLKVFPGAKVVKVIPIPDSGKTHILPKKGAKSQHDTVSRVVEKRV